ncbi:MAG: N-dimethylarginine dimethylaminohydrolase, partial [Dietzia sp.]|nr:N-dimethylarginine dimethylaminohydrolase [Dietzia sp.]
MDVATATSRPAPTTDAAHDRSARPRRYLMTPPTYFAVEYVINPWMDMSSPVDSHRALAQWEQLRQTYLGLGHTVELIEPISGLPDMVYAANGGTVVDGRAVVARFAHAERAGESVAYAEWMSRNGYQPCETRHVNEGQGDFLTVGSTLLAGHGFRTDRRAHDEVADHIGVEVVSLELVDPRFYHLDTALAVLDSTPGQEHIAYLPSAFDEQSLAYLRANYPDAIIVTEEDAAILGLNSFSDGFNVV